MQFKVIYKSRLVEPEVKFVDCSNKVVSLYELQYDANHIVKVVKTGDVNIYEKIQTYANDNDFSRILKNIELTQNYALYAPTKGGFVDTSDIPSDLTSLLKQAQEAEVIASKLKNDEFVKSKGISFKDFIANYSEKEHFEFLKNKYEKKEDK